MEKEILMGDEAVGLAALHAGIKAAYSYPGTPATEIFEFIQRTKLPNRTVTAEWSSNEKVAYEEALGMSYTGGRTLVSMKHVGLNVAADPFMNSSLTGVDGGFIIAVCDDPSMHSSQNEQDSRCYADFALIPCFEPSNQQEAYDMTREAYRLSELYKIPVMMRLTTRLAHSRSQVMPSEWEPQAPFTPSTNKIKWTLLPPNARQSYKRLTEIQKDFIETSQKSPFNSLTLRDHPTKLGIICSGITYNYYNEVLPYLTDIPSILKIGMFPVPEKLMEQFLQKVDDIIILEEGYPLIEKQLVALRKYSNRLIRGRLDGTLPRTGELSADIVRSVLTDYTIEIVEANPAALVSRPPQLCSGCPHIESFVALNGAIQKDPSARVFSDIGCYTLGYYPPYESIHTCVDMGASISMSVGSAHAGLHPSIAVIGESTFCHSGITGLLDAIHQKVPITVVILDNSTVGMTGGQENILGGESLLNLVQNLGIHPDHVLELEAKRNQQETNIDLLKKELDYKGVSVVIFTRECIQTAKRSHQANK